MTSSIPPEDDVGVGIVELDSPSIAGLSFVTGDGDLPFFRLMGFALLYNSFGSVTPAAIFSFRTLIASARVSSNLFLPSGFGVVCFDNGTNSFFGTSFFALLI